MDTGSTLTKATATLLAALAIQPGTAPQDTNEEPVIATAPTEEVVEIVIDPQGRWAVEAFEAAGLEFPQVSVLFHDTKDVCQGNVGGYTGDTVHVCITAEGLYRDKILLHELGHAWAARNLTDGQMAEFIELRDAESWNDSATEWGDRGFEQAAEILAWGLLETATTPTQISDSDCDSLTNAFQLLTGTEVPRDQICS
jgi:hypothetical protein